MKAITRFFHAIGTVRIGLVIISAIDPLVTHGTIITPNQPAFTVWEADGKGTSVFTVLNDGTTPLNIVSIVSFPPMPIAGDTTLDSLMQVDTTQSTCPTAPNQGGLQPNATCSVTYFFQPVDNDPGDVISNVVDSGTWLIRAGVIVLDGGQFVEITATATVIVSDAPEPATLPLIASCFAVGLLCYVCSRGRGATI
jgi:hypothetical protein